MLVLLLPASESSCLWSLHCKWVQSQCSLWPPLGGIYPTPPPLLKLESVRGWRTEVNETAPRRGESAGEKCSCVRACACVSVRVTVSAHGGGRREEGGEFESEEEGGTCGRETETNDCEHQTTQISTQSQRYRKEDQQNLCACTGMK